MAAFSRIYVGHIVLDRRAGSWMLQPEIEPDFAAGLSGQPDSAGISRLKPGRQIVWRRRGVGASGCRGVKGRREDAKTPNAKNYRGVCQEPPEEQPANLAQDPAEELRRAVAILEKLLRRMRPPEPARGAEVPTA
ncbi:unnamed protein product [Effrenium voratum]|nr:unnamed protein product [Effrenium voratum]